MGGLWSASRLWLALAVGLLVFGLAATPFGGRSAPTARGEESAVMYTIYMPISFKEYSEPSPIATPTATASAAVTSTPTTQHTPPAAPTSSPTGTGTATPTRTPSPSTTVTATATWTSAPTRTPTATPTNTPVPPGYTQILKAVAYKGVDVDAFGGAVAVEGDIAVVGAYYAMVDGGSRPGKAYVFRRPLGGSWADATQVAILTASDGGESERFGYSVAISGDVIAIGASQANVGDALYQGVVYVFVKPETGWAAATENARLIAAEGVEYDYLGSSVAVEGDVVVAGAPSHDIGGQPDVGKAYVFVKPGGEWSGVVIESAKLSASDGVIYDQFGVSVGISGDTIVVGANKIDVAPRGKGSAYVFTKPGATWADMTQTAKLTASDGVLCDQFGKSVAISGDTIVVGATQDGSIDSPRTYPTGNGKAYVFVKPAGEWSSGTETALLTASDGAISDYFGAALAVESGVIVVGAYGAEGAAYIFAKPLGGWADATETIKLVADADGEWGNFGSAVALSGETLFVGAPEARAGGIPVGAMYAFQ